MAQSSETTEYKPRLNEFGQWASARVQQLATGGKDIAGIKQPGYLQNGAYATSAIAKLNRSVGHKFGDDFDIMEWTYAGLPEDQSSSDPSEATTMELAAHAVITLFAAHQHSVHEKSMNTSENMSLGRAIGQLATGDPNEKGIRRTFMQVQSASSWSELVRHARRLIKLLKRDRVQLNYGLFAQDILLLQKGGSAANQVRTRWGKDFISAYKSVKQADSDNVAD